MASESFSEDAMSLSSDLPLGRPRSTPKRMAEDKLHEKRLKERARRNGMAKSIDQMRVIVPELMDAKKVYSQAKVVAIALQHIYELQRENGDLRQRLGMKPRDQEPRPLKGKRGQTNASQPHVASASIPTGGVKREAPAPDAADERAKKRRRVEESPAVSPVCSPVPAPSTAPTSLSAKPPSAAALRALLPAQLPPTSGPASSAPGAPVQLQPGMEGTLDALVVDSNSPSSFDEDETHMVSDTPLNLSPRHEHEDAPQELFTGFSYPAPVLGSSGWEEHEPASDRTPGNPHVSHDSTAVELMLQSVLSTAN